MSEIDDGILYYEMLDLMGEEVFEERPEIVSSPDLEQREFKAVKEEFLAEYKRLVEKIQSFD